MSSDAKRRSVLLVDDDPSILDDLASMLRTIDYTDCVSVETGAQAREVFGARTFDLIIVDVNLGKESGIDLAMDLLRSRDVPALFCSDEDDFAVGRLAGHDAVFAFLPKPIRISTLLTTVQLVQLQHDARIRTQELQHLLAESQRIASIGTFQLTFPTNTVIWTDETYVLHGVSRAFTPTLEAIVALIHPDDRELFTTYRPKGHHGGFEYRVGTRQLRFRGEWTFDADGTLQKISGTVQDITAHERAIEANRAKTEFLAQMSHELRTPLNAVLGLSEAMIETIFGAISPRQEIALQTIHASGKHLLELINDVLDIARVEAGKLNIEPEPVELRPVIDEVTSFVIPQLSDKRQRLILSLAPALPPIMIDRRRIKQVLLNLLGNASKFSPGGTSITLSVDHALDAIEIAIEDHGPGITEDNRERIFEPFVTLDPSNARLHGGAGLGLSLAKRFVELHHGALRVERNAQGGSTFIVKLPVSTEVSFVPSRGPQVALGRARRLDGLNVVVAEDSEATSLAVRAYLEELGGHVHVAADGVTALECGSWPEIEVMVVDIQLPRLDGLQVISRVRALRPSLPIIAVTAHAMPGDEQRCLDAGATIYMAKPVPLRVLAESITELTREHAA